MEAAPAPDVLSTVIGKAMLNLVCGIALVFMSVATWSPDNGIYKTIFAVGVMRAVVTFFTVVCAWPGFKTDAPSLHSCMTSCEFLAECMLAGVAAFLPIDV